VAASEIAILEGQRCLIVERFDRRLHFTGSHWRRLPTEDFCRATATPPAKKYENQGGPGMVAISELLAQSSAAEDRHTFYRAQVLFWMMRAIDGHAKNFSLFLNPGGRYQLTPFYDILSAWPVIGSGAGTWPQQEIRMAMAWCGTKVRTYKPLQIQRCHLISTARRLGLGAMEDSIVDGLVKTTPAVIDAVKAELPSAFPEALAEAVFKGLQSSADQIASQNQ
jgi:serine/threonine-protein kinase HipA